MHGWCSKCPCLVFRSNRFSRITLHNNCCYCKTFFFFFFLTSKELLAYSCLFKLKPIQKSFVKPLPSQHAENNKADISAVFQPVYSDSDYGLLYAI